MFPLKFRSTSGKALKCKVLTCIHFLRQQVGHAIRDRHAIAQRRIHRKIAQAARRAGFDHCHTSKFCSKTTGGSGSGGACIDFRAGVAANSLISAIATQSCQINPIRDVKNYSVADKQQWDLDSLTLAGIASTATRDYQEKKNIVNTTTEEFAKKRDVFATVRASQSLYREVATNQHRQLLIDAVLLDKARKEQLTLKSLLLPSRSIGGEMLLSNHRQNYATDLVASRSLWSAAADLHSVFQRTSHILSGSGAVRFPSC